jgi:hypothetical protein
MTVSGTDASRHCGATAIASPPHRRPPAGAELFAQRGEVRVASIRCKEQTREQFAGQVFVVLDRALQPREHPVGFLAQCMHVHDGTIQPVAGGPRNKDLQHRVGRGAVVADLQCQRHVRVAGSIERLPGFSQRRCGVGALDFDHREPAMHLRGAFGWTSAILRAALSASSSFPAATSVGRTRWRLAEARMGR